jgi:hypothetical protein
LKIRNCWEKEVIAITIIIRVDTDILGFEQLPSTSSGNENERLPELACTERLVSLSNHAEVSKATSK